MPSETVTIYTYANCSTCRDAVKWLREHQVNFKEKPIYATPPSVGELKRMLEFQGGNLRRLFNTSGLEYRAQKLADRFPTLTEDEAFALLAGNGRLVKRPFLLAKKFGIVGFDPEAWEQHVS